uniref:ATP synthase protein MI25 n=1 Tax=Entransia fimbriata TaxID=130991 RepID=U5YGS0_9VIRI|nr:ATP synthase F0 subunit beta [Entransia fimbriata]AGZ90281.1 ATP synthase F0 subunit beta [Entransia fimbriata]
MKFFIAILIITVVISKQLLILNEEILVAFSFFGFVYFVQTSFGNTFKQVIDSRSTEILSVLKEQMDAQHNLLTESIQQYTLISSSSTLSTSELGDWCSSFFAAENQKEGDEGTCQVHSGFKSLLNQQLLQKLNTLSNTRASYQDTVQKLIISRFTQVCKDEFRSSKKRVFLLHYL